MKQLFAALSLVFLLSFGGIGESQTKSQFPKIDQKTAVGVIVEFCPDDTLITLTGFGIKDDLEFLVYSVDSVVFAIVQFVKGDENLNASAIYVLRPDGIVEKYLPSEFKKIEKPCETRKALGLKNRNNNF
jgi:hypothetical protein